MSGEVRIVDASGIPLKFHTTLVAESYGASPSASASKNAAAIQQALTAANTAGGAYVSLLTPGTYLINNTLNIYSQTYFMLGPGVTIKMAPNTNKTLLLPASFLNYLSPTTITISWSAGAIATVTWTGHGLTARDYVYIQGAAQREYNNVFPILSVVDVNSFTINLFSLPTASASGTITALVCTREFIINGGTWDLDFANNGSGTGYNKSCMGIFAAANFTITNCVFKNFQRGITSGGLADCVFDNLTYDSTLISASEGHKTFGPANNVHLKRLAIRSTDDGSSVQPKEAPAFQWTGMPFGDVYNLTYEDCDIQSSGAAASGGLVLYLSDNEIADNIKYINSRSYSDQGTGFVVKFGSTYTAGKAGKVFLDRMNCTTNTPASQYAYSFPAAIDVLEICDPQIIPGDLTNTCFKFGATTTAIKTCIIRNMRFNSTTWPSAGAFLFNHSLGSIENIKFENCAWTGAANFNVYSCSATAAGAVFNITFDNCELITGLRLISITSAVTQKHNLTLRNCYLKSLTSAIECQSSAVTRLHLYNNFFDTVTRILRPSTTAALVAQVFGSGNTLVSTGVIAAVNSATAEFYTFDLPIDVATTGVAKTAGSHSNNTNTASGPVGLVVADGTAWREVQRTQQSLTSSANAIAVNCYAGTIVTVPALQENTTIGAPTNPLPGMTLDFIITQNGTGGFTVAWNAVFKFTAAWTNTGNTANKKSGASFKYDGTNWNNVSGLANTWN